MEDRKGKADVKLIQKFLSDALRSLTMARGLYMENYRDDWDADYMAGKFDDAQIIIERIQEETEAKNS